jgi:hypothetical protein
MPFYEFGHVAIHNTHSILTLSLPIFALKTIQNVLEMVEADQEESSLKLWFVQICNLNQI